MSNPNDRLDELVGKAAPDVLIGRSYEGMFDAIYPTGKETPMSNKLKPNAKASNNDFWEAMLDPNAPDEMVFQIDKAEGNTSTFSQEGVNELAEQFRLFLMARIYGQGQRTGIPPRHLRVLTALDWAPGDPLNDPKVGPFFSIDNDTGITPLDGTRREHSWRGA